MADDNALQALNRIAALMEAQNAKLDKVITGQASGTMFSGFGQTEAGGVVTESGLREDFLSVVFDLQLAALATGQISRTISQDGHFDMVYITGRSVITATGVGQPNLQLRIMDSGSSRYLTEGSNWIHWQNLVGNQPDIALGTIGTFLTTANAPFTIPGRRRFNVGSLVTLELQNLSANPITVQLALHGIKVFAEK